MAHNICEKKIAYYGVKPWHGIGKELDAPATAEEAIVAAGLDYTVERAPVHTAVQGTILKIADKFATVRCEKDGRKFALGVVGDRYKIIQNKEAFSFFDDVVGSGEAKYQTAGALGDGERIWLLAKLPKSTLSFKDDVVEKFLCLTNSHDGGSALRVYFTPIRVVCQNTLNISLKDAKGGISIRHSGDLNTKVAEAQRVLGFALKFSDVFDKSALALASKQVGVQQLDQYINRVFDVVADDATLKTKNARSTLRTAVLGLFDKEGAQIPAIRGTAWAAYNAVTGYVDHLQSFKKGSSDEATNRLKSIWFGNGAEVKSRAYDEALAILN